MPSFDAPTVVDLFCGAGGLSLGLRRAGFNPIYALDKIPAAVETYGCNLGHDARLGEVSASTQIPSASMIAGGPPCQGFSSAGMRRKGDHRNSLIAVFAAIIVREKPKAFFFENVEGFLTTEGGNRVLDLLEPLVKVGYRIHLRKINAANYGVPQHRKRVIAIGGLGWTPPFPEPTHSAFGAPGAHLAGHNLPSTPTLIDAISGLPFASTEGQHPHVTDHKYRSLTGVDLERATLLAQGQCMRDLPEMYWHDSYKRRAFRRVKDGTPTEQRGGAPAGIRRLRANEPCKAITSGARSEFLHPIEHRALTLRECARVQTFPDTFTFAGTLSERALLIGNAVPPRLAEAIGSALIHGLREDCMLDDAQPGALLSFVPTLSNGMSPALKKTTDMVSEVFSLKTHDSQMTLWP